VRLPFALVLALGLAARADELSGADKLRVVYSNQFAWTDDGLPVVTVRIAEGRDKVVLRGPALRVFPDGEGGPEIRAGSSFTVRLEHGRAGKVRYHVVVARVPVGDDAALKKELDAWRARGEQPRTVETGALFAVKGEVLDQRKLLVVLGDTLDEPAASLDLGSREELLQLLGAYATSTGSPAMVMVTHHVEEIPPGFTHALLLAEGKIAATGPIAEIITGERLSEVFGLELLVSTSENGRYSARAA